MSKTSWPVRLTFLCVTVVTTLVAWVCLSVFVPRAIPADRRYVFVRKGATVREIVTELQSSGIIGSTVPLLLLARGTGIGGKMKAGGYRLEEKMSPFRILQKIASGKVDLLRFTIPEGFTLDQIAERVQEKSLGEAARFRSLALHPKGRLQLPSWVPPGSLEGFLFPDTYFVPLHESEEQIIGRVLQGFESTVLRPLQSEISASSLGLKGTVTLASLVEREARVGDERTLIAGVLLNRLRQGKRLECDATVQYALGQHKERLFYSDLDVDSPYNTYRHAGLPPGPIANPGLSCIKAALSPEKSDYLFYVAKPEGRHIFSRTLSEHQQATRRLRAARK